MATPGESDDEFDSDISVSEESDDDDVPLSHMRDADEDIPLSTFRQTPANNGCGDATLNVNTATTTTTTTPNSKWSSTLTAVQVGPFNQPTGPVNVLPAEKNELDFLNLLFPDHIYDLLAAQTNLYAYQCSLKKADSKWRDVTVQEIKAFVGLHVIMSVIQLPAYKQYWSTDPMFKIPSVPAIMARDRFDKILQYFHCNDSSTNPPRGEIGHDKIHHVRPIFDIVQQCLTDNYYPHQSLSLDEAMIPFRGRISYRQYLPAKPCKFGVKVWELADSTNGYVFQMQVYTGKSDTGREVGLASRVVTDLTRIISGKNHHVYMDNYFSSVNLFQALLKDGIYACGTCRVNRKGWPDGLHKNCLPKTKGKSKSYQNGNLVATSWYDNRQVNFLSTNSDPTVMMNISRKQKDGSHCDIPAPQVVENYNLHINGVDHGDQLRMQYSTTRKSKKFWKYMFWFLFDTAVASAFILMRESPNHQIISRSGKKKAPNQLEFRQNLAKQLIGQYRQKRRHSLTEEDRTGRSHWPKTMESSRRCKLCLSKKIRKESKYGCVICNVHLCVECFEPYHVSAFAEEE